MKRSPRFATAAWLYIGLASVFAAGAGSLESAAQTPPTASPVFGEIAAAELSGAAVIDGGRLVLVGDDGNTVIALSDAGPRLLQGKRITPTPNEDLQGALKEQVELDDLEAVAWDGADAVYLITSHSRSRLGDNPPERFRLARLQLDKMGRVREAKQSEAVLSAIVNELPFLADALRRTPSQGGFNIEGLTWTPEGNLLLGFRSPTITESTPRKHGGQEDAVVVRVKNPTSLFEGNDTAMLADVVKLDLRGQGIRGMDYDPARNAYWLLSGLAPDPNYAVTAPWALWLWNGKDAPQEFPLPQGVTQRIRNPEAVTRIDVDGRRYLLLVEDAEPVCPYVLIPLP